jgi:hypothetical protein
MSSQGSPYICNPVLNQGSPETYVEMATAQVAVPRAIPSTPLNDRSERVCERGSGPPAVVLCP